MKHFLKETDFTPQEAAEVFALARELKRKRGRNKPVLAGRTWAADLFQGQHAYPRLFRGWHP